MLVIHNGGLKTVCTTTEVKAFKMAVTEMRITVGFLTLIRAGGLPA